MAETTTSYRQKHLFPESDQRGPFERLLEKECSATGYVMLKRFARRLDYLARLQRRNDAIRREWRTLRGNGISKDEAFDLLSDEYQTGRDNIDLIIYPRLNRER